jgi:hypothetical protein
MYMHVLVLCVDAHRPVNQIAGMVRKAWSTLSSTFQALLFAEAFLQVQIHHFRLERSAHVLKEKNMMLC